MKIPESWNNDIAAFMYTRYSFLEYLMLEKKVMKFWNGYTDSL